MIQLESDPFTEEVSTLNKWKGLFCVYLPSIHCSNLNIWFLYNTYIITFQSSI